MSHPAQAPVPVFKLYGETRHWPTPDLLHCESIPERSRLHDWHIRPHRHADLVHVLHIASGQVKLELEGTQQELQGPLVIVVPAMTIHGFRFSQDIEGHIVTLAQPLAEQLGQRLEEQARVLRHADYHPLTQSPQARRLAALVEQIDAEYRQPAPGRDRMLSALVQALAVALSRLAEPHGLHDSSPRPRQRDRGHEHLTNFQALIEAQYRQQPSVERFAEQLGMSSAHLNALCRRLADRSALQLLHERLLLEAKRQLTYTNMTISQVADSLGFSEPAYFTRFFKRNTGLSPKAFRLRQSLDEPAR
ncbi:MAG: helix-turn-helix domain-containing protein [Halomonas sp.]|jgi:AraC family transcriptional activator of pobA|uniref:Helix-turn-helix domain-containing protein n=1 Tax=Billgrantia tianxiuensis TaxID=2497861 RepID=A0A6I6SLI0_9GAMM|nr:MULTISPECIES: helix-turn-helix domain-containing protein [Halomonas]MCE8035474.1 helix-turn-helix domain-containing protein [Halomonas sp. MCCC 1A11057]MDX5435330.1 helix-turn-helix domain-containing protein [Halomonas sp.]MDX5504405.1 helix-turn-helix domain-containing protein [Halomonas sp.]QHC51608.1 helix-turn-helix domain-containing protein [Halomonas tianxiuensis]